MKMANKANSGALPAHPIFEPEVIPTKTEQELQGPRLVKTKRP